MLGMKKSNDSFLKYGQLRLWYFLASARRRRHICTVEGFSRCRVQLARFMSGSNDSSGHPGQSCGSSFPNPVPPLQQSDPSLSHGLSITRPTLLRRLVATPGQGGSTVAPSERRALRLPIDSFRHFSTTCIV